MICFENGVANRNTPRVIQRSGSDEGISREGNGVFGMKYYYVYIMTNKFNTVLYIGVTNDIERRVAEHKSHSIEGFTAKYKLDKCVYVEECGDINDALQREKQLKGWSRAKKFALLREYNPNMEDLSVF